MTLSGGIVILLFGLLLGFDLSIDNAIVANRDAELGDHSFVIYFGERIVDFDRFLLILGEDYLLANLLGSSVDLLSSRIDEGLCDLHSNQRVIDLDIEAKTSEWHHHIFLDWLSPKLLIVFI